VETLKATDPIVSSMTRMSVSHDVNLPGTLLTMAQPP
jgi:hypothetical protein